TTLRGWNERVATTPWPPPGLPSTSRPPRAQAASSMIGTPAAAAARAAPGPGRPSWPMAITARVRGPRAASTAAGVRFQVARSTSAAMGTAPRLRAALAAAGKPNDDTTTSSPRSTPRTRSESSRAAVPDDTATAPRRPVRVARSASKRSVSGPMVSRPERRTRSAAADSASPSDGRAKGIRSVDGPGPGPRSAALTAIPLDGAQETFLESDLGLEAEQLAGLVHRRHPDLDVGGGPRLERDGRARRRQPDDLPGQVVDGDG